MTKMTENYIIKMIQIVKAKNDLCGPFNNSVVSKMTGPSRMIVCFSMIIQIVNAKDDLCCPLNS